MLKRLWQDQAANSTVEFVIAAPVLVSFMVGILQIGQVMHANGAMRNAIGDGIRYAKVYPDATETQVLNETRAGMAGVNVDGITELQFVRGTANGAAFGRITMQYELQPMIPFAPMPPIVIEEERTAYLPS
ncbi:MAG TPA: TadE/TadG family type IV pilus assembly protein [Sphingomonadaceae bacterium]|nr:TadE/TadG family type IV pilus assembly protein [Sphingomonadaceae bacterium]